MEKTSEGLCETFTVIIIFRIWVVEIKFFSILILFLSKASEWGELGSLFNPNSNILFSEIDFNAGDRITRSYNSFCRLLNYCHSDIFLQTFCNFLDQDCFQRLVVMIGQTSFLDDLLHIFFLLVHQAILDIVDFVWRSAIWGSTHLDNIYLIVNKTMIRVKIKPKKSWIWLQVQILDDLWTNRFFQSFYVYPILFVLVFVENLELPLFFLLFIYFFRGALLLCRKLRNFSFWLLLILDQGSKILINCLGSSRNIDLIFFANWSGAGTRKTFLLNVQRKIALHFKPFLFTVIRHLVNIWNIFSSSLFCNFY